MTDVHSDRHDDGAEELLRRALLDAEQSTAVALRVEHLPVSRSVTVIFHGRRDLGTVQTYVAGGGRHAGEALGAGELLRVPCDLDLADAGDREEAEVLYVEQARALRDAMEAADTVLDAWREPLSDLSGTRVVIDRSIELRISLPAHRLLPTALAAPERGILVAPVCGARTLVHGRPPLGIVCAQQDLARIYPLPDDPERCIAEFLEVAASHARALAQRLDHQESSVERFLEISGDDLPQAG